MIFKPLLILRKASVVAMLIFCFLFKTLSTHAQVKQKQTEKTVAAAPVKKNYPSLLWEISGNGLKKPSYLFGTMHVSNKLVFNLDDSFYNAIKNVDVVAIEQDPEVWQDAYSIKKDDDESDDFNFLNFKNFDSYAHDRLTQHTFSLMPYETKIKIALASEARMLNSMLYRNENGMEDFEEETYLDMYIYRLGCKLHKKVTGVENYKETNKLVKEAYLAMFKDKNRRMRGGFDYDDRLKLENAYRQGDLDMLDSLELMSVVSEAFEEKFMYKRNDIQANSIDTIVKKNSLFVAVGVAHLPGKKGVIEILRKKGYTLRPVTMGVRNSSEKEKLDELRVPVNFSRRFSEDSVFSAEMPGKKFFRYKNFSNLNMTQYADMPNGSYYLITRIRTNASLLGHSSRTVQKKIDSLFYENIPGKIISKKEITKDGFPGFDIRNRTRKGNEQRYNIYVLPDEIVLFKTGGPGSYVNDGNEADKFFSSINFDTTLINYKPVVYESPYGGFKATFPAKPSLLSQKINNEANEWISHDEKGNAFFILKTSLHQYDYIEEDSFELRLMEESFLSSPVFKESLPGKTGTWNNYPILNADYTHNDGSHIKLRYIIQGNNYYIVGAKCKSEGASDNFINSFSFTPNYYGEVKKQADSVLGYTVNSPLFYKVKKDTADEFSLKNLYRLQLSENEDAGLADDANTTFTKVIGNDTTGERIDLFSTRLPRYGYFKDSAKFFKSILFNTPSDSDFIIRFNKSYTTPSGWLCHYYQLGDTGSSRTITVKSFYKNGVSFCLSAAGDTISKPGYFVNSFFESFTPADTFAMVDPFKKKSDIFFNDYFSSDSLTNKKALQAMDASFFDSSDLPQIKKAIDSLSWKKKNYLSVKTDWIDVIGSFHDTASVNYLSQLYKQVKDTAQLQNTILDALLNMRTLNAYNAYKDLIVSNPPALSGDDDNQREGRINLQMILRQVRLSNMSADDDADFYKTGWQNLYDTLQLSSQIIPGLLDLITLDEYKDKIINLLAAAVDSGYIKQDDYKQYFNKFLLEARQELKKQTAVEEEKELKDLSKSDNAFSYDYFSNDDVTNDDLDNYAVLLMPFWSKSDEVPAFFDKLSHLKNKSLKMHAAIIMLRNKKPLPAGILDSIAADNNFRVRLYNNLKKYKLLENFPAQYKNQLSIARSILMNSMPYSRIDSLVYIDKLPVNEGKLKGWVYFFKATYKNDFGQWYIAYSGLQPADTSQINSDFKLYSKNFVQFTQEEYKEPVKPKLEKLLKRNLYELRKSASQFYGNENDSDDYMVDAVKENRFE